MGIHYCLVEHSVAKALMTILKKNAMDRSDQRTGSSLNRSTWHLHLKITNLKRLSTIIATVKWLEAFSNYVSLDYQKGRELAITSSRFALSDLTVFQCEHIIECIR